MINKPNPFMLEIGRGVRGLSIKDLSDMIGIPAERLTCYEMGKVEIPKEVVDKLSEVLSFPIPFFYREGQRAPVGCTWVCKR